MALKGPLSGVRILDLTQATAGPYGAQTLANLGADMIKIEPPMGEIARMAQGWGPARAYQVNKKAIVLDLWTESGRQAFHDLVKVSDVVFDNWRGEVTLKRVGADYDSVKKVNPRIISASVAGYGTEGPYSAYPTYDLIGVGMSGMASLGGYPGGKMVAPNAGIADMSAGILCAAGIITALYEREKTGVGRKVTVNMLDTCMSLIQTAYQHYFTFGKVPERQGPLYLGIPTLGFYRCKDGFIALGPCWPQVCQLIGREGMAEDPRYRDLEGRVAHRDELEQAIEEALQEADVEEWVERFAAAGIECSRVNTASQALADPQVVDHEAVVEIAHHEYGAMKTVVSPIKVPGAFEGEYVPAPMLGEHTDEVLKGLLGYSDERIAQLKREQEENWEQMQAHARKVL